MDKLVNYYTLSPWKYKEIEDMGGYISEDFKKFARTYKNYVKRVCKAHNWELVEFSTGHYYCSWFIKNGEKYIYCSFSDVRHFQKEWYKLILYRTAKSEKDYTGGSNNYTDLQNYELALVKLFERM